MAYMEIFGNASHHTHHVNDDVTMMRHSMHTFSHSTQIQRFVNNFFHSLDEFDRVMLFFSQSLGFQSNLTPKKPALPPKQKPKFSSSNASLNNLTPPVSPKISNDNVFTSTRKEAIEKENLNQDSEEKINNVEPEVVLRRKPAETVGNYIVLLKEILCNRRGKNRKIWKKIS